jgi:hypothetical protein
MTDIAPPATGVWYDPAATLAAVNTILRLSGGDIDEDRLAALVPVAAGNIDAKLDGTVAVTGPPAPPWTQTALELEVVALYRNQNVDVDPWMAMGGARPSRDALVGGQTVAALVGPHKARWGVS